MCPINIVNEKNYSVARREQLQPIHKLRHWKRLRQPAEKGHAFRKECFAAGYVLQLLVTTLMNDLANAIERPRIKHISLKSFELGGTDR